MLMLTYFGYIMQKQETLDKTLVLGKIRGKEKEISKRQEH